MVLINRKLTVILGLIALGVTGTVWGQEHESTAAASGDSAVADHATAYYHYMLARRYKELAGTQNRLDYVDKAVSEYRAAIAADPNSLFLRVELAELYARTSKVSEAIKEADAVLQINPNQIEAHRLLAEIYFHNLADNESSQATKENLEKAIHHLEAVTHIDPKDSASLVLLGRLYKADNQPAKAEETFKRVLQAEPDSRTALASLAQVYFDQGDYKQSIELIKRIPDDDLDVASLGLLGSNFSQIHDYDNAARAYERALKQDSDNEEIRRAYAEALANMGKTAEARVELEKVLKAQPDDAFSYLRLGRLDRETGKFDQARQELGKAKSLAPDNPEVSYEQVLLEEALGNDDKAIELLQAMLQRNQKPSEQSSAADANNRAIFLERLGLIYRTQEKYDQAIDAFKQIVNLGKDQAPRGEGLIIETLRLEGQPDKALKEAQTALKQYPNDRSLIMLSATIMGEEGKVEASIAQLKTLLKGGAEDAEIYRAIAQVNSQAKRFPDAEAAARKSLEVAPTPDGQEYGHFLLGSIYEREKQYDRAEEEFKQVLVTDPTNAPASNYLGYMLADRGIRLDESIGYIQKALQLDPNNGAYLDSLGWAYYKMHRLDLAQQQLEKAVRLISSDPTIHEHLGSIYLEQGKKREAAEQWEHALRDWPHATSSDFDAAEAARLKKQLEDLK